MPRAQFKSNGVAIKGEIGALLPPDESWLAQRPVEKALLPDLPIIDTHHHLWVRPDFKYLLPEFAADLDCGHNIVATVYAECHSMYRALGPDHLKPVGETEFVVGQSAQSASGDYGRARVAAGLFGYADLTLGASVREVLEAHVVAANGRFKGIRFQANWDASDRIRNGGPAIRPGMLIEPAVHEGLKALVDMGLVLDCQVFFPQLPDVAKTADAFPNLTIVLNHCGGPLGYGPYAESQAEHYAVWRRNLIEVARRTNVVCKLGGILVRTSDFDYINEEMPASSRQLAEAWRRWVEPCIDAFGAHRCMFESNYPVEKLGISYGSLWNAFKHLSQGASKEEKTLLFSETAKRIYRLSEEVNLSGSD
jgi:predicted TIM-barrel fold metal-dependent hydrolase